MAGPPIGLYSEACCIVGDEGTDEYGVEYADEYSLLIPLPPGIGGWAS